MWQGHVVHLPVKADSLPRGLSPSIPDNSLADFEAGGPCSIGEMARAPKGSLYIYPSEALSTGSPQALVLLWIPRAMDLHTFTQTCNLLEGRFVPATAYDSLISCCPQSFELHPTCTTLISPVTPPRCSLTSLLPRHVTLLPALNLTLQKQILAEHTVLF